MKTGGRKKGTPNKLGFGLREKIINGIEKYWDEGEFTELFKELTPMEKLNILTKLLNIALPKVQAVSLEMEEATTEKSLSQRLIELAEQSKAESNCA